MNDTIAEAVCRILQAEKRVAFAILFGSMAAGQERPDSDVDIGVGWLPGQSVTLRERFDLALDLERVLGREVDLVDLDDATPLLRFEAARGACIFERHPSAFGDFVARALLEFDDVQPHLLRCGRAAARAGRPRP